MQPDLLLQLISQLGSSGILLWLLLEERKARQQLESKVFQYLEDERDVSHPKPTTP